MENIMVCVTKQKTCQRLIDFGKKLRTNDDDQLFIIHVAHTDFNFLGNSKENEALEFLYSKAMEVGANLTVEKSNNVLETLVKLVVDNKIDKIIVGESGEEQGPVSFLNMFDKKLNGRAELIEVPA